MDTRFVVRHLLQYTVVYGGLTVGVAFLVAGPGLVVLTMFGSVLLLLFLLSGEGSAHAHASDPVGWGSAIGSGEGDHVSLPEAAALGGAGRLYYAVGVLLFGVVVVATQL
ncbi:MAG: hypothetical protein ABEI75_04360 [Halobaculum sp.]